MAEFKLSASLKAHEDDVRAVAFPSPETILSASRDCTVRVWTRTSPTPPQYDDTIATHGTAFINAIAYVPSSSDFPEGLIVSGGKDTIIDVRPPGRPTDSDAERLLLGHQGNVCALDVCQDGKDKYLVSGSWDASAMVWNIGKGESTTTLEGHEASVWAVLAYDRNTIITGCADKLIRIYRTDGKLMRRIHGSTDVVRALCRLPESAAPAQFGSAGNDGIIRLWTLDGVEVAQLHGHENFVYSLAVLPTGELVSSSEDRTMRIWNEGQCIQTITHPAISVWSVAVCAENGDIVTGASDKIVRVFTRSAERFADAETTRAFEDAVKGSAIPQQQMGDINKEKLPGPEFLTSKSGTKEGQVQLIRESNGNVSAYQWSTAASQWLSVGTVVDAVGSSGRKQEYMGQDYDYVFDVDIAEGKPPLKLPYNLSQNPYEAAQKFIQDNELPMDYLDQVANFIVQNTQGASLGQQSDASAQQGRPGGDPWGQESRYRPGDANGYSSTSTQPAPPTASTRPKVIPQKTYLTITPANFPALLKKIQDLNSQHLAASRKELSLSPGDIAALTSATKILDRILAPTSSTSTTLRVEDEPTLAAALDLATKISTQWPTGSRIPGLDLYRLLAAATPSIISPRQTDPLTLLSTAGALPQSPISNSSSSTTQPNPNEVMLALRTFANIFAHTAGRSYSSENFTSIRTAAWTSVQHFSNNRNVCTAAMTLYINYGVLITSEDNNNEIPTLPKEAAEQLISDLVSLLADPSIVDSEVVYRALVALGTLLHGNYSELDQEEKQRVKAVLGLVGKGPAAREPRVKGVVGECVEVMG